MLGPTFLLPQAQRVSWSFCLQDLERLFPSIPNIHLPEDLFAIVAGYRFLPPARLITPLHTDTLEPFLSPAPVELPFSSRRLAVFF